MKVFTVVLLASLFCIASCQRCYQSASCTFAGQMAVDMLNNLQMSSDLKRMTCESMTASVTQYGSLYGTGCQFYWK